MNIHSSKEDGESPTWRPIHYLGSKLRLLGEINSAIVEVGGLSGRVCDIFSGSGTVFLDQAKRRPATAVDVQEYSRVICGALVSGYKMDWAQFTSNYKQLLVNSSSAGIIWATRPLIEFEDRVIGRAAGGCAEGLCSFLEAGSPVVASSNGLEAHASEYWAALSTFWDRTDRLPASWRCFTTITRHFGGLYFSFKQAAVLDTLAATCSMIPREGRDLAIAALLTTASQISNTVGKQFAQPIRPRDKNGNVKSTLYDLVSRDRFKDVWPIYKTAASGYEAAREGSLYESVALRADYRNFLRGQWDDSITVVYADPPYTRDHYSRFYHALETIALGDDPMISKSGVKSGASRAAYRSDRHQSPFCIKSEAIGAFEALFRGVAERRVPLVLSYSGFSQENGAHPRVVSLTEIERVASQFFRNVSLRDITDVVHSRLNKRSLSRDKSVAAESLIICVP